MPVNYRFAMRSKGAYHAALDEELLGEVVLSCFACHDRRWDEEQTRGAFVAQLAKPDTPADRRAGYMHKIVQVMICTGVPPSLSRLPSYISPHPKPLAPYSSSASQATSLHPPTSAQASLGNKATP